MGDIGSFLAPRIPGTIGIEAVAFVAYSLHRRNHFGACRDEYDGLTWRPHHALLSNTGDKPARSIKDAPQRETAPTDCIRRLLYIEEPLIHSRFAVPPHGVV